jgi:hypothetical protein
MQMETLEKSKKTIERNVFQLILVEHSFFAEYLSNAKFPWQLELLFSSRISVGFFMAPQTFCTARSVSMFGLVRLLIAAGAFVFVSIEDLQAGLIAVSSPGQFATGTAGRATSIVDFDSSADGTVVPNNSFFQTIRFDPNNSVNGDLIVSNGNVGFSPGLKTISGLNYLGSSIGDVIKQSFVFTFQTPVTSVGLYFISPSQLNTGEIGISVGGTPSLISSVNEINLGPTAGSLVPSFAYFVGIYDTDPLVSFTNVTVNPNISGIVDGIGIDSISYTAVPEPNALILMCMSALVALFRKRILRTVFLIFPFWLRKCPL